MDVSLLEEPEDDKPKIIKIMKKEEINLSNYGIVILIF